MCIPTRNRPAYLRETLSSVLAQTVSSIRVIVSDDASEPDAARVVEAHVIKLGDPRVSYTYHARNLQEYDHGRFLFGQCREPLFAILHDDDRWEPRFLARCMAALEDDPSLACVTTDQCVIDAAGARQADATHNYRKRMGRDRYPEGRLRILEPLLTHSLFALSCTVFRTASLQRSGLVDPECHGNSIFDINLFLRLGERDEHAYYLPEMLADYRVHGDRLTNTEERGGFNPRLLETLMAVLEKRRFSGIAERERRRQMSAVYHNYAMVCALRHDRSGLYRYLGKCLRMRPDRWQNWGYLGFAVAPFLVKPMFGARADFPQKP